MNAAFMREALALAAHAMRAGQGGPFGAVIVRAGRIIARGSNQVLSTNDPTAHAEIVAIRAACRELKSFHLEGCELYTTCEPCPMCLGAVYWTRIEKLHYAAVRQDAADAGFIDEFIYRELDQPIQRRRLLAEQSLRDEALALFAEWKTKPDKILY